MAQRYRRAERLSQLPCTKDVRNTRVVPHWVDGASAFWYERETSAGREYRLVTPHDGKNELAFDHCALAEAMRASCGETASAASANALPILDLKIDLENRRITFVFNGAKWIYDTVNGRLAPIKSHGPTQLTISPDGLTAAFVDNFNIWILNLISGERRQLTFDGEQHFGYASDSSGHARFAHIASPPTPARLLWAPDGSRIFAVRIDTRKVVPIPVLEYAPPRGVRPKCHEIRWALPGDTNIPVAYFVAIEAETARVVAADHPALPLVRMNDSIIEVGLAWFGKNSRHAYFVDVHRGEGQADLIEFDTHDGNCRIVFSEKSETYLEFGTSVYSRTNVHYLDRSHKIIWCSERNGNSHLYLYDLLTGEMEGAITQGDFRVRDVIRLDQQNGEVWFTASGFADSFNPYYRQLCRVRFDGSDFQRTGDLCTDYDVLGQADFALFLSQMAGLSTSDISGVSPDGRMYVATSGTVSTAPRSALFDRDGKEIMHLETADFSAAGDLWTWPEAFSAKAADGKTDLYGVIVRPSDFSSEQSYPIIDHIYGGPQTSHVPKGALRDFSDKLVLSEAMSLAELGCIVIVVDGRGTALRDRAFHEHSYGAMQNASDIDDHVAVISELAERYSYMDPNRVGITGISGGGYATAHALLARPDFFKVGVASSGNYDGRLFLHGWSERYQGLLHHSNYDNQQLLNLAPQLQGKILFTHGLLDHGCHPAALFQLTEALAEANKDYDLILDATRGHERSSYVARRIWDYFVTHLLNEIAPPDIAITHGMNLLVPPSVQKDLAGSSIDALSDG
jgi:dienelactone hydrolase